MYDILARELADDTEPAKDKTGDLQICSNASRQILETIFRLEYHGLVRFLTRQVGPDSAADLAQEVFLRAAASTQLQSLASPRGFLYCIARNAMIDRSRRQKCRIVTQPLTRALDAVCAAQQEQLLEEDDLKSALDRALSGLPHKTRTIFILHRFEEMSYRAIHRELGISVAAVEYHMMKALAHLRAAFAERIQEPQRTAGLSHCPTIEKPENSFI
jgi:RNA polymerase sigma factor (sigma-70 family)